MGIKQVFAAVSIAAVSGVWAGPAGQRMDDYCPRTYAVPLPNKVQVEQVARQTPRVELPNIKRTPAQSDRLLKQVMVRLLKGAEPICHDLQTSCEGFEAEYDPAPVFNATAVRASRIVRVFSGMAQILEEPQLAAVMAHEMAHHLLGHAAARDRLADATTSEAAQNICARRQELESDYVAAYILQASGYDPRAGGAFLNTFRSAPGAIQRLHSNLGDDHPTLSERLAVWQLTLGEIAARPGLLPPRHGD